MAATQATPLGKGVQELITQLRTDGKLAGEQDAAKLIEEAKAKAAELIKEAEAAAAERKEACDKAVAAKQQAAISALKVAARDTILELKSTIALHFEGYLRRLVAGVTQEPEFVKALVLTLAGQAAEDHIADKEAVITVRKALLGDGESMSEVREAGGTIVQALAADMLREGIGLHGDETLRGGAKVQLVKDKLEIDLSDTAITTLLRKHLLPRFQDLLDGND